MKKILKILRKKKKVKQNILLNKNLKNLRMIKIKVWLTNKMILQSIIVIKKLQIKNQI